MGLQEVELQEVLQAGYVKLLEDELPISSVITDEHIGQLSVVAHVGLAELLTAMAELHAERTTILKAAAEEIDVPGLKEELQAVYESFDELIKEARQNKPKWS